MPFAVFEHTADIGLDVEAADLPSLLRDAAMGMVEVIHGPCEVRPLVAHAVEVRHRRLDRVLMDLLDEILYLQDSEGLVFGAVGEVRVERLDGDGKVVASLEDADGARPRDPDTAERDVARPDAAMGQAAETTTMPDVGPLAEGEAWRVATEVRGEPFDRTRHVGCAHVKAVTFHELGVRWDADAGLWRARVILDV